MHPAAPPQCSKYAEIISEARALPRTPLEEFAELTHPYSWIAGPLCGRVINNTYDDETEKRLRRSRPRLQPCFAAANGGGGWKDHTVIEGLHLSDPKEKGRGGEGLGKERVGT